MERKAKKVDCLRSCRKYSLFSLTITAKTKDRVEKAESSDFTNASFPDKMKMPPEKRRRS
ncbi:hypothetical protein BSM4216_3636 [Bacillus smithii]|nr:hypothetical protein BSM4216_3636 [Bacillus smithii]